jgi:hypothetical protein
MVYHKLFMIITIPIFFHCSNDIPTNPCDIFQAYDRMAIKNPHPVGSTAQTNTMKNYDLCLKSLWIKLVEMKSLWNPYQIPMISMKSLVKRKILPWNPEVLLRQRPERQGPEARSWPTSRRIGASGWDLRMNRRN